MAVLFSSNCGGGSGGGGGGGDGGDGGGDGGDGGDLERKLEIRSLFNRCWFYCRCDNNFL